MTFINEKIPAEDKKKYNMNDDSNFYLAGTTTWTVDRERDMFLLRRTGGGAEGYPIHHWAFYWRGHMLDLRIEGIENGEDKDRSHGWTRKKIHGIGGMTTELLAQRAQILDDLREAFVAMQIFGALSPLPTYSTYDVTLETA